jgi:hypothetical protein
VELSPGAIRNHRPEVMKKAFAIAGYDETVLVWLMPRRRCRVCETTHAEIRQRSGRL